MGYSLDDLERYEEALESYDKALKINPNNPDTCYNKVCSKAKRGNKENAIKFLKEAIELDDEAKIDAKSDSDFDNIKDVKEFKN